MQVPKLTLNTLPYMHKIRAQLNHLKSQIISFIFPIELNKYFIMSKVYTFNIKFTNNR